MPRRRQVRRLAWISRRAAEAFYFVNSANRPSIELHAQFGFREFVRDFRFLGATFSSGGGFGILFHAELPGGAVPNLSLRQDPIAKALGS